MPENVVPFFCFIIFFFVLAVLDLKNIKLDKYYIGLYYLAALILILFAGLRWSSWRVGYETWIFDYDTYHQLYDNALPLKSFISSYIQSPLEIQKFELGYLVWNSIVHSLLGVNFNIYLLITNFLVVILLLKAFSPERIKKGIFIIIFFYVSRFYFQYNFTLLRQAIAIGFVWVALDDFIKGNLKKYYILVALAISFHFSALVAIVFPLLTKIRFNNYIYFTILVLLVALGYVGISGSILTGFINFTLGSVGLPSASKFLNYLDQEGSSNFLNFIEAIPFFYIAITQRKSLEKYQEGIFYINMLYCYILLMALTMNLFFFSRFWQYMMFSYVYLLSFFFQKSNNRQLLTIMMFYCILYSFRYIMMWFYNVPFSCYLFNL